MSWPVSIGILNDRSTFQPRVPTSSRLPKTDFVLLHTLVYYRGCVPEIPLHATDARQPSVSSVPVTLGPLWPSTFACPSLTSTMYPLCGEAVRTSPHGNPVPSAHGQGFTPNRPGTAPHRGTNNKQQWNYPYFRFQKAIKLYQSTIKKTKLDKEWSNTTEHDN